MRKRIITFSQLILRQRVDCVKMITRRPELTLQERKEIVVLHREGMSFRKIGKLVNRAPSTVKYTIDRFNETKSNGTRAGKERYKILSEKDHRYIRLLSIRDRRKTLPAITSEFNSGRQLQVSHSTIRRSLLKWGLVGRVAARKPLLRKQNIRKRLAFARKHVNWTKSQWKKVLFTDESKFELFGTKRRTFVRRLAGERFRKECLTPTVKHGGGSIMVWGGICVNGKTKLKKIEGIMDQKMYHGILVHHAIPSGKQLIGKGFVFQEDNDPKHSSKLCRNYLTNKEKEGIVSFFRL